MRPGTCGQAVGDRGGRSSVRHGHGAHRCIARGVRDEPGGRLRVVEGRGASRRQGRVGTRGWGSCNTVWRVGSWLAVG